jgi:hypothetical protein
MSAPPRRRPNRAVLHLERLEVRQVLSTLVVVPHGGATDATHFADLAAAVTASQPGDLIQVEPGSDLPVFSSTTLATPAHLGDTQVTTNGPVPAGLKVFIEPDPNTSSGSEEPIIVDAVSPGPGSTFRLTLHAPLGLSHAAGAVVQGDGPTVAITKVLTIQGDPAAAPPAVPSLEVFAGVAGVAVQNVNLPHLTLDPGTAGTAVRGAHLGSLFGQGRGTLVTGNTIDGSLTLSGGVGANDVVEYNTLHGPLKLFAEGGALVLGNTIDVVQDLNANVVDAVDIQVSDVITLSNNTITFHTSAVNPPLWGMAVHVDDGGVPAPIPVNLLNNDISTQGQGVGILTRHQHGSDLRVWIEGNDLRANLVGLYVVGDGSADPSAAGTIDAGGGTLGSRGGNNFRGFRPTTSNLNAGRFAIYLTNLSQNVGTVTARYNVWSIPNPGNVVKDGDSNPTTGGGPNGDGAIDLGAAQLTTNEQYVQTLYHDFLGRTASTVDLVAWNALFPRIGRLAVVNGLVRSPEALTRLVDRLYLTFLNRPADTAGEAASVGFLQQGGTEEQLIGLLLASPEYSSRASILGNPAQPDASWITAVYQDLLGRTASPAEINGWLAILPTQGRFGVAMDLLASAEYRTGAVLGFYMNLLNRASPPSSAELAAWVNTPYDLLTIEVALAASDEFRMNG